MSLTNKQIQQLNQLLNANYLNKQDLKETLDLTQSLLNEVLRNVYLTYFEDVYLTYFDDNSKIIKQDQHLKDFQELYFFEFIKTKLDFLIKQQKKIQKNQN